MKKKFDFEYKFSTNEYSRELYQFVKDNSVYIDFYYCGFHFHDYPWEAMPMLGKSGFKLTTKKYDEVPLSYWIQKIAPFEKRGRDFLNITFDNYPINSIEQITKSIEKIVFDLDNCCGDFLRNDIRTFDKIREIQYLESLVRLNVYSTHYANGDVEYLVKSEPEIE